MLTFHKSAVQFQISVTLAKALDQMPSASQTEVSDKPIRWGLHRAEDQLVPRERRA